MTERPSDWRGRLDGEIDSLFETMQAVRRHLHMYPELSGEERQTAAYLASVLKDGGVEARTIPSANGLLVDGGDLGAPRAALRGDIDALRLHDAKQTPYRSRKDGLMHACGHDMHAAGVVGALLALDRLHREGALPGPLAWRGVLQPAEETAFGAAAMVEAGALEDVTAIFALHVDPSRDVGRIGLRSGALTASCDWFELRVIGRGGHAARPHESEDPIAAAAHFVSSLYAFVPRSTDSHDPVVVTVGQIEGGYSPNVIPETVALRGTIRTLEPRVREATIDRVRQLARGVGEAAAVRFELSFHSGPAAVVNDEGLTRLVRAAAGDALGADHVEEIPRPSMGGEDFSGYLEHVPGAMFRLGVRSPQFGGAPLHSPLFDADERALAVGAKILARAVVLSQAPTKQEEVSTDGQDALHAQRDALAGR